ncbi:hypothetical protein KFL_000090440 [Klebsormidium nitens]|uniref:Uncharacterized protein n=1 Tax=Klebsormidium nitens TaxID=105231 RepID=A0A1Y1HQU4_KLENI|nr:hypothetical protein KFL_000090440 [Klebsormidium nitens]|eukprot:GAQ78198.1 hypothetical protein KFL_000090440 [Klebsormidium nitens]
MDMDGARGLPGLRSAWRSDLSPRANRIINDPLLNDIDIDNVRIEVFDVSAQLVDIPLTETADEPNSLPVIQNGLHHVHTSRVHGSNGEAHPRKEHVVEIPALGNHTIRTNGVREDNGRPHGSNGYVSENGQARHDRHPPPIKASSKKPPRCPTSHNGLNGDSGHHPQNGRRRRDSTELDRSKGKRGGGAAKWKMKLVMAILLVCFGTLVYFQVFYMRPQQLQAIMQGASQKEVLRAGLLNFGRREGPEDGVLRSRGEGNITDGLVGMRRRLLGGETEGGEQCSLIEGMRWFGRLLNDVRIRRAGNEGGGILVGGSEAGVVRLGRRLLAEGRETGKRRLVTEREGQRHERMEALDWGFGVGLEFLRRRPGSRDTG